MGISSAEIVSQQKINPNNHNNWLIGRVIYQEKCQTILYFQPLNILGLWTVGETKETFQDVPVGSGFWKLSMLSDIV